MSTPKPDKYGPTLGCLATIIAALITTIGALLGIYIARSRDISQNVNVPSIPATPNENAPNTNAPLRTPTPQPTDRETPAPSQATNQALGVWYFRLSIDRVVGKDGFIKKKSGIIEMNIRLLQTGELLTGDLLGTESEIGTVCSKATVDGKVQENNVSFILKSIGSCCSGEQKRFTLTLSTDGKSMTGYTEPVDVPTTNCFSVYADVLATKR